MPLLSCVPERFTRRYGFAPSVGRLEAGLSPVGNAFRCGAPKNGCQSLGLSVQRTIEGDACAFGGFHGRKRSPDGFYSNAAGSPGQRSQGAGRYTTYRAPRAPSPVRGLQTRCVWWSFYGARGSPPRLRLIFGGLQRYRTSTLTIAPWRKAAGMPMQIIQIRPRRINASLHSAGCSATKRGMI